MPDSLSRPARLIAAAALAIADPRRATRTPGSRYIDPRGMRFGAGLSAVVLAAASTLGQPLIAILVGVSLLISAALGTRYFLLGRPWPRIRAALRLAPVEPEHEYPPRFAQAMGGTFIGLGAVAFLVGAPFVGWILVAAVGALQAFLAITGICVGCRLYFLRWWIPDLFARAAGRSESFLVARTPLRRLDV